MAAGYSSCEGSDPSLRLEGRELNKSSFDQLYGASLTFPFAHVLVIRCSEMSRVVLMGRGGMSPLFRRCGMLQRSRTSPGRGCGSVPVWPVRQCPGLGAREARRGELITNRTYP
ncbi:hypothetical protein EYF80_036874 [Liparis tanakae]|uniref:Uncharacterized protein n=1 Tax=Liparis tanakae TaxID=230148 RepID=A0A4Z2GHL1_9TELE|nr:hypothetical protein EYF80_036874 [Liparis tanakae]